MTRWRAAVPLCLAVTLSSCAYYNGMYNTRRFAGRAENSERAGRPSEAAERWRQVVIHADTLLARHPRSRWADDAELLKGRALVALEAWPAAVTALRSAVGRAGTDEQAREARYWLGLAYTGRGDHARAIAAFDSALAAPRREQREAVLLARGRTRLAMGRPDGALRDLAMVSLPAARFERARAAIAMGQVDLAAAFADSAVGVRGTAPEAWRDLLDTLAARGSPEVASRLVDALVAERWLTSGMRARFLLADGDRWEARGDHAFAQERWELAARSAPDSAEARAAEVRSLRVALRSPDAALALPAVVQRLNAVVSRGGEPAREASDILRVIARADSVAGRGESADAHAFQAAGWLRDSLGASALAAERFAATAAAWPESPWAPKALIAAIAAGHPAADSLAGVLQGRYASSPYAGWVTGAAPDPVRYAALEDSLAGLLVPAAEAVQDTGQRGAVPGSRTEDAEDRMQARRDGEARPAAGPAARADEQRVPVRPEAPSRPAELPRNPEP